MNQRNQRQKGQALVEYVMAVLLCISVSAGINSVMKRGIARLWKSLAKDIAAGCPGCQAPDEMEQ